MKDQLLQMAFAVYNNPGVFALLLGSGISRPAEIPTGWEIVVDLIEQIADALGEEIAGEPDAWYLKRFDVDEIGYSDLVKRLGKTSPERNALLRGYFERNEEDIEEDRKLPTKAHHAIAWLVQQGYIRVILTTNFDPLLENALRELSIEPLVVSTDAAIEGMRPLRHNDITIIKLHGHYLDDEFLNTADQLSKYSDTKNRLLDEVLDQFGLIVCGWSAEWDAGLREAIYAQQARRYTVYWSWYGRATNEANELIDHHDAEEIQNIDADTLFVELREMVEALANSQNRHQLAAPVAVERTKKLLRTIDHIGLEELIRDELENAYNFFTSDPFVKSIQELDRNQNSRISEYWQHYFEKTEVMLNIVAILAWYGKDEARHIEKGITRWGERPSDPNRIIEIQYLATLQLIYTAGIAAVSNRNWHILPHTLIHPIVYHEGIRRTELALTAIYHKIMNLRKRGWSHEWLMIGRFLHPQLRSTFSSLIPSDEDYNYAFDLFEMLFGLAYLHLEPSSESMPVQRIFRESATRNRIAEFWAEGGKHDSDWELLKAGLFDGSTIALLDSLQSYQSILKQVSRAFHDDGPNMLKAYRSGLQGE